MWNHQKRLRTYVLVWIVLSENILLKIILRHGIKNSFRILFFCHQCPTLVKPLACRSSAPALMPHSWHQLIVADHDFEMDFSRRNFINRMAGRAAVRGEIFDAQHSSGSKRNLYSIYCQTSAPWRQISTVIYKASGSQPFWNSYHFYDVLNSISSAYLHNNFWATKECNSTINFFKQLPKD